MPEEVSKVANTADSVDAGMAQSKEAEANEEPKSECSNGVCTVVWKPAKAA